MKVTSAECSAHTKNLLGHTSISSSAQRGRSTSAGVAGRLEQSDASVFVPGALRFGVHVGLIVAPKRDFGETPAQFSETGG